MLTKLLASLVMAGALVVAGDAAYRGVGQSPLTPNPSPPEGRGATVCCYPGSECCYPGSECCWYESAPAGDCCASGEDCCPVSDCCAAH